MGLFLGKKWSVWAFKHIFMCLLVQLGKFIRDSFSKLNLEQNSVFRILMVTLSPNWLKLSFDTQKRL